MGRLFRGLFIIPALLAVAWALSPHSAHAGFFADIKKELTYPCEEGALTARQAGLIVSSCSRTNEVLPPRQQAIVDALAYNLLEQEIFNEATVDQFRTKLCAAQSLNVFDQEPRDTPQAINSALDSMKARHPDARLSRIRQLPAWESKGRLAARQRVAELLRSDFWPKIQQLRDLQGLRDPIYRKFSEQFQKHGCQHSRDASKVAQCQRPKELASLEAQMELIEATFPYRGNEGLRQMISHYVYQRPVLTEAEFVREAANPMTPHSFQKVIELERKQPLEDLKRMASPRSEKEQQQFRKELAQSGALDGYFFGSIARGINSARKPTREEEIRSHYPKAFCRINKRYGETEKMRVAIRQFAIGAATAIVGGFAEVLHRLYLAGRLAQTSGQVMFKAAALWAAQAVPDTLLAHESSCRQLGIRYSRRESCDAALESGDQKKLVDLTYLELAQGNCVADMALASLGHGMGLAQFTKLRKVATAIKLDSEIQAIKAIDADEAALVGKAKGVAAEGRVKPPRSAQVEKLVNDLPNGAGAAEREAIQIKGLKAKALLTQDESEYLAALEVRAKLRKNVRSTIPSSATEKSIGRYLEMASSADPSKRLEALHGIQAHLVAGRGRALIDERYTDVLTRLLKDKEHVIRMSARRGLLRNGKIFEYSDTMLDDIAQELKFDADLLAQASSRQLPLPALGEVRRLSPSDYDKLVKSMLRDPHDGALELLGRGLRDGRSFEQLRRYAAAGNALALRKGAVAGLARNFSSDSTALLIKIASEEKGELGEAALNAVLTRSDDAAVAFLKKVDPESVPSWRLSDDSVLKMLQSENEELWQRILSGKTSLEGRPNFVIHAAARSDDPKIRKVAMGALERRSDPESTLILRKVVEAEPVVEVKLGAARALLEREDLIADELVEGVIDDPDLVDLVPTISRTGFNNPNDAIFRPRLHAITTAHKDFTRQEALRWANLTPEQKKLEAHTLAAVTSKHVYGLPDFDVPFTQMPTDAQLEKMADKYVEQLRAFQETIPVGYTVRSEATFVGSDLPGAVSDPMTSLKVAFYEPIEGGGRPAALAFAGTNPKPIGGRNDWYTNFTFGRMQLDRPEVEMMMERVVYYLSQGQSVKVTMPLAVGGHSLGGALTEGFLARLAKRVEEAKKSHPSSLWAELDLSEVHGLTINGLGGRTLVQRTSGNADRLPANARPTAYRDPMDFVSLLDRHTGEVRVTEALGGNALSVHGMDAMSTSIRKGLENSVPGSEVSQPFGRAVAGAITLMNRAVGDKLGPVLQKIYEARTLEEKVKLVTLTRHKWLTTEGYRNLATPPFLETEFQQLRSRLQREIAAGSNPLVEKKLLQYMDSFDRKTAEILRIQRSSPLRRRVASTPVVAR